MKHVYLVFKTQEKGANGYVGYHDYDSWSHEATLCGVYLTSEEAENAADEVREDEGIEDDCSYEEENPCERNSVEVVRAPIGKSGNYWSFDADTDLAAPLNHC